MSAETVNEHIKSWLVRKTLIVRTRTIEQYRHICTKYIEPAIGNIPNENVNETTLYKVLEAVEPTRTRQICYAILKMLYPALMVAIKKPRHDAKPPQWWSAEQATAFLDRAKREQDELYMCWVLAIYCGLRRGELAGLRWTDIDMISGVIHIRRQRQRVGGTLIECTPKTRSSIRDIPIGHTRVYDALLDHYTIMAAENVLNGRTECPYVLSKNGMALKPEYIDYALRTAVKRHNTQKITCHQLRHTCATICITSGVPLNVVSELLGHGGVAITAAVYAHVQREAVRNAICSISDAIKHYEAT